MALADWLPAIAQGLTTGAVLLLAVVGLMWRYGDRVGRIQHDIGGISNDIEKIVDAVRQVDLKEMEKTILRLEYKIDDVQEAGNSVIYELDRSGIEVTISLAQEPHEDVPPPHRQEQMDLVEFLDLIGVREEVQLSDDEIMEIDDDLVDLSNEEVANKLGIQEEEIPVELPPQHGFEKIKEPDDGEVTHIILEFDERIRSRSVANNLAVDGDLEDMEMDMWGYECGFNALSPLEMHFSIPTESYDEIAQWLDIALDKIDKYHVKFDQEAAEFDRTLESKLK